MGDDESSARPPGPPSRPPLPPSQEFDEGGAWGGTGAPPPTPEPSLPPELPLPPEPPQPLQAEAGVSRNWGARPGSGSSEASSADDGPRIPWEERARYGAVPALVKTIGLFMTSPSKAFAMTRRRGDYLSPIVFALIVGWLGFLAEQCWSLVFQSTYLLFLPQSLRDQLGWVTERTLGGSIVGFVMGFALFPFAALVGLFISAAVLHLFLMLLGATSKSHAGFEGTVRVLAYSSVATLGNVIPFAGSFIAFFWAIVLQTIGAAKLHETGKGRVLFAILIPIILCCACMFLFVGAIVTILGAVFAGVGA